MTAPTEQEFQNSSHSTFKKFFGSGQNIAWLLTFLSIIGAALNVQKRPESFVIWSIANIGWIAYKLTGRQYAEAVLFSVYLGLSISGIFEWYR